jgi:hypothetical protein
MPSLRSFIASKISISIAFTTLERLTNLEINYLNADFPGSTSKDIHKILSASPQLERLSLCYPYGGFFEDLAQYPPVALPLLVKLHLGASFTLSLFSRITSYFQVPSCTDLKAGIIDLSSGESPYPPLMPALFDLAPKLMARILKAPWLEVVDDNTKSVTFRFESPGNGLEIKIYFDQMAEMVEAANAMNCTVRLTPGYTLSHQEEWCKLAGTTHITVPVGYFGRWLGHMTVQHGKEMAWVFPSLEMIVLKDDRSTGADKILRDLLFDARYPKKGEGRDGRHVQVDVTAVQGITYDQVRELEKALYPTVIVCRGLKLGDENHKGDEDGDDDSDEDGEDGEEGADGLDTV